MTAYRGILVAVDGSLAGARGLSEAIRLAKAQGAQLFVLHVVNDLCRGGRRRPGRGPAGHAADGGKRILAKAEAAARKHNIRPKILMRETLGGPAADPILREAKRQRADVIVLGTHGRRGLRRLVLGSDAEQVVRSATVPVLLVRSAAAR